MGAENPEKRASADRGGEILCVLLGASNLSRAYRGFTACLERGLRPRPVSFLNAMGPGRGYCVEGGFLSAVYPPIGSCGAFAAARAKAAAVERVVAVVADIGNDIMYGVPADKIVADLSAMFQKLRELGAVIVAVPIPKDFEEELGAFYFGCLRLLFYPGSRVGPGEASAAVRGINRFLEDSAAAGRVTLVGGLERYCGADKIHYGFLKMHLAWSGIAREVFRVLKVDPPREIGLPRMAVSLGSNLLRLFLSDVFPLRKKGPEFF